MSALFKILKDNNNDAIALDQLTEGEVFDSSVSAIGAFVFKDKDGNAVAPQLNPEGAVVVSFDAGTTIRNSAKLAKASQTKDAEEVVAEISLTASKTYNKFSAMVSCFRASLFRFVAIADANGTPVETELGYALIDAGNINENIELIVNEYTAGATGDQVMRVLHTPLDQTSDAYASLSANEIA